MLRALYDRILTLAAGRFALPALAAVAFAESAFLPVPPDMLLAPMVLARRERGVAVCGGHHHRLGAGRPARLRHRVLAGAAGG